MHRIMWRRSQRQNRPTLGDLTMIADPMLRQAAFAELNRILDAGLANVYIPAAADFWNIWLGQQLAPPYSQRVHLEDWSQQFVAQYTMNGQQGGAA